MLVGSQKTARIGDFTVSRPGFGAMHLTGRDCWGPPDDRVAAIQLLRDAVDCGINFIDTADSYGGGANEELIAEALSPYPDDLLIGTKAGQSRPSPSQWTPLGRPEYLRQQVELSLLRLRVDRLDLFQLHRIDPLVPVEDQFGVLSELSAEGKVRHVGLSEVSVDQIKHARQFVDVVSVQNRYNLSDRAHESVLDYCTKHEIAFIPWLPIASGDLSRQGTALAQVASELDASTAQIALAWLMTTSPVVVPIPGTQSTKHLIENFAAGSLELNDDQYARISNLREPE